ncbi:MAG: hypothetical protein JST16_14595 [Bdellovibrionales bacterium]|nr:hypothetical protein [Bdellovibrionales bacterium]
MKVISTIKSKAKNWVQFFATPQSLWTIAATAVLSACATIKQPDEGKVIMNPSSDEIHARFDTTPPVRKGEELQLSRRVCKMTQVPGARGNRQVEKCSRKDIGKAVVVRTYNARDFVMKAGEGVQVQEGDFVRRNSASDQTKEGSVE